MSDSKEVVLVQQIDGYSNMGERAVELSVQAGRMEIVTEDDFAKGGDLVKIINSDLKKLDEKRKETTEKPREYVNWVNAEFKKLTDPLNAALKIARDKMTKYADEVEAKRRAEEKRLREEAEARALEEAAAREAAAKKAADEAAAADQAAADALAVGDTKAAEEAAAAAEKAKAEEAAQSAAADEVMNQAADAPVVDTALKGVRGNYGSNAGMKKVWKFDVVALCDLPDEYQFAIVQDEKCQAAIRAAVGDLVKAEIKIAKDKNADIETIDIPGLNVRKESQLSVR